MEINVNDLRKSAAPLSALASDANEAGFLARNSSITGSYSKVSGLDQMGQLHGDALRENSGSAANVFAQLATVVTTIAQNLDSTAAAFTSQDDIAARAFDAENPVGESGAAIEGAAAALAAPIMAGSVLVAPSPSSQEMNARFAATRTAPLHQARNTWSKLCTTAQAISKELGSTASFIGANNSGDVVDAMASRISQVASRAGVISDNSWTIYQSLSEMYVTQLKGEQLIDVLDKQVQALKAAGQVEEAIAIEKAGLRAYEAYFQAALGAVKPKETMLTSPDAGTAGGDVSSGMGQSVAMASGAGYVAQLPESVLSTVRNMVAEDPESFARVNEASRDLATIGGIDNGAGMFSPSQLLSSPVTAGSVLPSIDSLGTSAASAGIAPSVPGVTIGSAPVPLSDHNAIIGASGFGLPRSASSSAMRGGAGGLTSGKSTSGINSSLKGSSGTSLRSALGAREGVANVSRGVSAGHQSVGEKLLGGSHAANDKASAMKPLAHEEGRPISATEERATARGAATATEESRASGRSTTPMTHTNGAGHAAGKGKSKKARAVISQIEREGNMRDLLGELPPVVPGVIGDWVREVPAEQ